MNAIALNPTRLIILACVLVISGATYLSLHRTRIAHFGKIITVSTTVLALLTFLLPGLPSRPDADSIPVVLTRADGTVAGNVRLLSPGGDFTPEASGVVRFPASASGAMIVVLVFENGAWRRVGSFRLSRSEGAMPTINIDDLRG